ncbi:sensor histidine kinase KdpD [Roseococcus sp. SDR]|uniref:sensor histidine kinase n=1 Tax=Roseococcus sp. SDR TaxID=2835532 RepID=UPI001BD1464F|nr:sensor histidine kinase KdpD [Roseococcus sp. SDR]MBS7790100.1 sensor histidine kinase KdpD [Roseococcus sp. SDR]MBV1845414.1 sensor histidine kinase KdpD [Roseococcus sp. SDR]
MSQAEPARPDPDALAELAAREGRGRLKVFLGAAPGVGKTMEMLIEGRRLLAAGRDVVIGLVETHGRAETEAAIAPLPRQPLKAIAYRGRVLHEFDLDAALARRPAILLLDELAHSNAPGSRHAKRWQDVEELRDGGIEVWTTMNVQHLESSAEAVARVTGVRVAETVPDAVLKGADAVELVDIPPAELLERMRAGKIYRPEQAERALRGFFKEGALAALRELALRRTADRVDADVTSWMRRNAVAGPWPVGDRVLALIPGGAAAEPVLHQARRLADALHAPLLALHVEQPGQAEDPGPGIALAQQLGAETEVTTATDLPAAIIAHARARRATHIILGRGAPVWWRRMLGRRLIASLARQAPEFTLHVVPSPAAARAPAPPRAWPGWTAWLVVPLLVGGATLACALLDGMVPDAAFGMVYLAAIVAIAATVGPLQAGAGAVLAFLAWNFLFLPPRYTLTIASAQDVLGAVVFGAVAALLAGTTGRLGRNVRSAALRLAALRRLTALSRRLNAQASMPELQMAVVEEAARIAGGPACLLLPLDEALEASLPGQFAREAALPAEPVPRAAYPADAAPDDGAMAAARWALARGRPAGRGTATLPTSAWRFLPLTALREGEVVTLGLLGLRPGAEVPDPEADRALEALLDQAAVALERARLADIAANARARGQTEALRTALLTSLGHDLRTPLTTIRGAAETLRSAGPALNEATRADLLSSIEEEATRLARWMSAILDIVRLETGQVTPRREPVDLAEAMQAAAERAALTYPEREIQRDLRAGLPHPRLDPALLDRVLENVLDNALKYSAPTGGVRLSAVREGAEVMLRVEDDGPGIPPEDLPRIFDPFFRAARADSIAAGSGLGLSICRGLVAAMGGRITAESPIAAGRGTRITLRFPA